MYNVITCIIRKWIISRWLDYSQKAIMDFDFNVYIMYLRKPMTWSSIARRYEWLKSRRTSISAQQLRAKLQRSVIVCKLSECFCDWKVLSLFIWVKAFTYTSWHWPGRRLEGDWRVDWGGAWRVPLTLEFK